jgi:hypothetical protein
LCLIILFEFLLYNLFLYPHYSPDCYLALVNPGHLKWAYLLSGRLLSSLLLHLADLADINLVQNQVIVTTVSLITYAFAIEIAVETTKRIAERWSLETEVLVAVALATVINSLSSVEHAIFTFQMLFHALAMLLLSLSVHAFFLRSYLTYFILAGMLPLIYQAYLPFPVSLILAFLVVYAPTVRSMINELAKASAPLVFSLALSAITLNFVLPALGYEGRVGQTLPTLSALWGNVEVLSMTLPTVFSHWGFFPPAYLFPALCFASVFGAIILGSYAGARKAVMATGVLLLVFFAVFLPYVPHIVSSHLGPVPRSMLGISSLPGFFFLSAFMREPLTPARWQVRFFGGLLVIFAVLIFARTQKIESDQLLVNHREGEYARLVVAEIARQEKSQGVIATSLVFTSDTMPTYWYADMGVGLRWSINQTAMSAEWAFLPMIQFYTGRRFSAEVTDPNEMKELVANRNWDVFEREQVIVRGTTAYVITY